MEDRRKSEGRRLTDEDIEAIVIAVLSKQQHVCRYEVNPEDLEASIRFHKHVDKLLSETGSAVRNTIIVAGTGGLISLILLGLYVKIRQAIVGGP